MNAYLETSFRFPISVLSKRSFQSSICICKEYSFANLFPVPQSSIRSKSSLLKKRSLLKASTRTIKFLLLCLPLSLLPPITCKNKRSTYSKLDTVSHSQSWLPFLEKYIISASFKEESDYLLKLINWPLILAAHKQKAQSCETNS